jgi:hypothetical protein
VHRYTVWNGPMPTAAAQQKVATGTAIKTMLQLATPSTRQCQLIAWGFSLDSAPAGGGEVELVQADVAATVTAHVASGIQPLDPNGPPSLMLVAPSPTGYTATAEGAVAATRTFDAKQIPSTAGASDLTDGKIWMPDARPIVAVSRFLRVRVTMAATVNMSCWFTFDE